MENNLLKYYSLLQSELENEAGIIENELIDIDDGFGRSVQDSKGCALRELDAAISRLQQLRIDVEKLSLKKLEEKYPY